MFALLGIKAYHRRLRIRWKSVVYYVTVRDSVQVSNRRVLF